jgi:hypothetical protein
MWYELRLLLNEIMARTKDVYKMKYEYRLNIMWNIDLVLMTLINWLLKTKCMLTYIFWNFVVLKFFISFEKLDRNAWK